MAKQGVEVISAGVCGDTSRELLGHDLSEVIDLLAHRKNTHGDFGRTADVAQKIKAVWKDTPNYEALGATQREFLDMTASKIARILCGNPNCRDHYIDIAGYAQLAADDL